MLGVDTCINLNLTWVKDEIVNEQQLKQEVK